MKRPLEGVRVLEIAHYVAVPAAGALLADLGADVVKVELPPRGEIYRRSRLRFLGYASEFSEYPPFQMDNRGKRSIVIDLTRPEAPEVLQRVIDSMDVVITNLLPGRRRKYGVDHESLLRRRPSLVVGAINGYGMGGSEADMPAFDYAAYWARTGMMDSLRDEGLPPSMLRPGVGDHAAGVNLVCGILAALRLRDATGEGRYVDVSLMQTGLHILGNDIANALVSGEPVKRHDRRHALNPLWNSYPVKDDRWLLLVMIDSNSYWSRFCAALGEPELEHDPRFASDQDRMGHAPELIERLESIFASKRLDQWRPLLDEARLIWAPVLRVEEVAQDPQARAMGYFPPVEHASAGSFETVAPPFRIEGVDLAPRAAAPDLHEHAEGVLREAGLSDTEIAQVLRAGPDEEEG